MKIVTRKPYSNEMPQLLEMWQLIFGKTGVQSFFNYIYNVEYAIVAEIDNKPVAMGYIVPAGDLINGSISLPCAMLYGIATHPQYRGTGLGTAVVNELISESYKLGFKAAVLCPSEDSLFEYYKKNTPMRDWFYTKELILDFPLAAQSSNIYYATRITPAEYLEQREKLLKNIPHIKHNLNMLQYQKKLCDELGGGLYKIGDSCAIVEVQQDGAAWVKELLTQNDDVGDIVTCITTVYEASEYIIRLPAKKEDIIMNDAGTNAARRFGMFTLQDINSFDLIKSETAPWYGIAFD